MFTVMCLIWVLLGVAAVVVYGNKGINRSKR